MVARICCGIQISRLDLSSHILACYHEDIHKLKAGTKKKSRQKSRAALQPVPVPGSSPCFDHGLEATMKNNVTGLPLQNEIFSACASRTGGLLLLHIGTILGGFSIGAWRGLVLGGRD